MLSDLSPMGMVSSPLHILSKLADVLPSSPQSTRLRGTPPQQSYIESQYRQNTGEGDVFGWGTMRSHTELLSLKKPKICLIRDGRVPGKEGDSEDWGWKQL